MRKITTILLLLCLSATLVQAQISIGGSIYGGGNAGNTGGSSKVTVYSGNLHAVFAGARMANVGGSSFVHLDGEHASDYILIDYVYGGNDIAGTIGSSKKLPTELTKVGTTTGLNNIDSTWNAFVRISPIPAVHYTQDEIDAATEGDDAFGKTTSDTKNKVPIYIGQLFGGGNGYYDYVTSGAGTVVKDKVTGAEVATSTNVLSSPVLGKTYLELLYNNQLAGLISYLREDKYLILCYFALDKQYRNQGIGTEVLSILADKYSNCTLIGEIEHPKDSLSKRRIGFYKRNNFYITDFGYKQPALIPNTEPVPLLIISYPKELTKTEYQTVKDIFYKKIYRVE